MKVAGRRHTRQRPPTIMKVKEIWTEVDFEAMSWHDSCIHAMYFPCDVNRFILEIDYLFSWEQNANDEFYKFWISPAQLTFVSVANLKIDVDFNIAVGLDIIDITRPSSRLSKNGKVDMWTYIIETDKGIISLESSGFVQKIKKQPVLSNSQVIPLEWDDVGETLP